jgi:hypothetical protein
MRIIDLTPISSTVGMPVKSGTIQHLQLAYKEAIAAVANLLTNGYITPDTTDFFILYGCVNSGSGLVFNITAGAIYYNGEVYLVPAASFTAPSGQTAVGTIITSQYTVNADPVTFTDGSNNNVHAIRTLNFAAGTSGSGNVDFSGLIPNSLVLANTYPGALPSSLTISFTQNYAAFYSSAPNNSAFTFNFTGAIPGTVVRLQWTYGASKSITVTAPGGSVAILESGSLSTTDGATFIFYAMFVGKDSAGNNVVSYNVKQV